MVLVAKERSIIEINEKISKGEAVVLTSQEFIDKFAKGENLTFDDVDVVTTATKGLMSGIMGIFSFRVSPPKTHRKFTSITMNDVPGFPGPCPNEFLGVVDVIVYATALSCTNPLYSGGVLFREIVEGKTVHVVATTSEGIKLEKDITIKDLQFARLLGTRQGFKNYNAMVNPTPEPVDTIFSVLPMQPDNQELTFSGCGATNMFQNDPNYRTFGVGSPMLVNGSPGHLVGPGTRNYVLKPNMMCIADFKEMKPKYMGGFKTSYGVEPICSLAAPIPILNEEIFGDLVKSDSEVPLTVMNVVGRAKISDITYGDVWDNNYMLRFDPKKCDKCDDCLGEAYCPTGAFHKDGIDRSRCFNCGLCAVTCTCCPEAFGIDMKSVKVLDKDIPVVLRQSDRKGANDLAQELKQMILKGEFNLVSPVAPLEFSDKYV